MSSKTKLRLTNTNEENKKLRAERQRLVRALSAIVRKYGPVQITYTEACSVQETDRVEIEFSKETGTYTIKLVETEDANKLGRGSEETWPQQRSGDVEGSVPKVSIKRVVDEVQEVDQRDSSEVGETPSEHAGEGRSE